MECCICKQGAKYKCPECGFQTCSLSCVKNHKFVYGCTGVAKPLKYIPVSGFTENKLQKDMNFLLDIARDADQSFKLVTKLSRQDNRKRFIFLSNECRAQGIDLKLMPKSMSRHANNSSLFDKTEKVCIWKIEWKVCVAKGLICCETEANRDDLCVEGLVLAAEQKFREVPRFVLEVKGGLAGFGVYYKVGKEMEGDRVKAIYREVDKEKSLREVLPGLSRQAPIVEFPTFYLSKEALV